MILVHRKINDKKNYCKHLYNINMKRTLIILTSLLLLIKIGKAQTEHKVYGKVERVSEISIIVYDIPTQEYEIEGKAVTLKNILKLALSEDDFQKKAEDLVKTSLKRESDGKIPKFDAILIDSKNSEGKAIKFKNSVSLDASIVPVKDTPVFLFSKPNNEYSVIKKFDARFSRRASNGLLHDKVKYIIKQSQNKVGKGELKAFDAIIINPKDFSFECIKFN